MKRWCFVHNDTRGLPPTVVAHIDQLRQQHPAITIETWGEAALRDIILGMPVDKLTLAFGPAPTNFMLEKLSFDDLKPVVDALAQAEPDPANGRHPDPRPEGDQALSVWEKPNSAWHCAH
jgi:hypothetical protein